MPGIRKTSKPYKTVIGWQEVEDYNERDGSRLLSKIAIGELREGSNISYIFEKIYTDILEDIKVNFSSYRINVRIGNTPQLIITLNDTLIIHNPELKYMTEHLKKIITKISPEYIINAYIEMRLNTENKSKLGNATLLLMSMINGADDTKYPVPFIQSIIKEIIEQQYFDATDSDVKEYIRSLDYKEMLLVINDIHRYKALKILQDEFLYKKIYSNEISINDLEFIVGRELIFRLYSGALVRR